MPKINQEEYEILKGMNKDWKFLARDEDGRLYKYLTLPFKQSEMWSAERQTWLKMNERNFQFIQWEDEGPYNVAELIEEYESEEKEVKKNIEWLKSAIQQNLDFYNDNDEEWQMAKVRAYAKSLDLINQLDEPEVLSQEWLDENKSSWTKLKIDGYYIPVEKLQNLLVLKQEEVDQAYKDGYETGKQHILYKGYLEGLEDKGSEPETVADVVTTFWKSYERLKEVMSMEVEELEQC